MRLFRAPFANQRGSMLLIVVTAGVLLAFVSTSLMYMLSESAVSGGKRSDHEAYLAMVASLRSQLEDPLQCYSIMGGIQAPVNLKNKKSGLTLNWTYGGSTDSFKNGWRIPGSKLTIKDISIQNSGMLQVKNSAGDTQIRTVRIKTGDALRNYRTVALRVHVEPKELTVSFREDPAGAAEPPEAISRMARRENEIRILANIDSSNKIYNCFGFESMGAICQLSGGAFNHLGPANMRCQPDLRCFTAGAVSATDACPSPYKAFQIGLDKDGNKKYMCRLCREDL